MVDESYLLFISTVRMKTKNGRMDSPAIGLLQIQDGLQIGGQFDEYVA